MKANVNPKERIALAGRLAMLLGFALLVFGIANLWDGSPEQTNADQATGLLPSFSTVFRLVSYGQLLLGALLIPGGYGLWRYRDWGRRLLVVLVWAITGIFGVLWLVVTAGVISSGGVSQVTVAAVAGGLLATLVWIAVLIGCLRFLRDGSVLAACHGSSP